MRLSIQADLTYSFEQPCEVLLLLEAARAPDQAIGKEPKRRLLRPQIKRHLPGAPTNLADLQ